MAKLVLGNLKKTDIERRLTIPSKSLGYFPPLRGKHTVDFNVEDESARVWKFEIYSRNKKNKYLKPVITKGWRVFVCSKELQVGDRLAFYMEEQKTGDVKYRVEVEKAVSWNSFSS
ncbi:hypothetical protein DITRI_Ditri08aG0164100 [Diplodiscus trichospermus]